MCRPPFRSRCMAGTDGKRSAAIAKGRRRRLEAEAVPGGGVREEAPLLQRRGKGRAVAVPGALASADRKRVVEGKRVSVSLVLGGRRIHKKKKQTEYKERCCAG